VAVSWRGQVHVDATPDQWRELPPSSRPEYYVWKHILRRCTNPRASNYVWYGARGIKVCDEWLDVHRFFADMGPRPSARHSIDRIDNDGDYAPDNCRWASPHEQAFNTSRASRITIDGVTRTTRDWARVYGVYPSTLWRRLRRGWAPLVALTTPSLRNRRYANRT
jgi:hypothetical protein